MISYIERTYFNDLLNRVGNVLRISQYIKHDFDDFTLHGAGIPLCSHIICQKGNLWTNSEIKGTMVR